MNALPANISISNAQLPQMYEAAKNALANCATVDECKDWADKSAALASYAKQANDETLMKQSVRIRDRAIRRMGEVLKQFDGRGGDRTKTDADDSFAQQTQREAARDAGISERQQITAVRVANVPEQEFEAAVESEKPPTISQLAQMGIKPRPLVDLKGRDPGEFNRAMHYVGYIEGYVRHLQAMNHDGVLPILNDKERQNLRRYIGEIDAVHDMIATRI
jgi:hypothetical protein